MAAEIRTITPDEVVDYRRAIRLGFANRDTVDDAEWAAAMVDPVDRSYAAFDAGRMVATLQSFPTELTLPGGIVPAGALTAVTCQPTHRRQRLLTQMISVDLSASKERGEPADVLIAAEYLIYGRFGYGPATMQTAWELDVQATGGFSTPGTGSVEFADDATFRKEAPAIFEQVRSARPGMIGRTDFDWDVRADLRRRPEDKPWLGFRIVCRDEDGVAQGYANYKIEERWEGMRPHGTVEVNDLCAATPQAEARMWRFLAELDLITTVKAGDRPTDDTLPWLLRDARAARRTRLEDFVWVRPLDVPALLEARSYDRPGRVVLEVVDNAGLASGRFALEATPDGATCASTEESAEITMPVHALGAVSLGGHRLAMLHDAGWLDEDRSGSVERADAMFAGVVTPWCNTWF